MSRDLRSITSAALTLAPAVRNAAANGTTVDTLGFDSAVATVSFGAYTDGTHTPKLQDSPDGTTYTDVAAGFLNGSFTAVNSAGGANTVQQVGYAGYQRYVRVVMTVAGATTGAATAAIVTRGHPSQAPTA